MKSWEKVEVVDGVSYRLKIFKNELGTGFDLCVVNDATGTFEVIDSDKLRRNLVPARLEYKSLLKGLYPNMILTIDKGLA